VNHYDIRQKAIKWMIERGWKNKWGKRGTFTQSLLQHTDLELNALCVLLPILSEKAHYGLDEHEQQALIVGTIAHDAGKETLDWQQYVQLPTEQQQGRFVPHIIPSLTESVVPGLVNLFGLDTSVTADALALVNLHMASARSPTSLMGAITGRAQSTDSSNRWNILARIVEVIDKFCSIRGLLPTRDYLTRGQDNGVLSPHIRLGYHLAALRGVSTSLLHQAASETYQEAGWRPILIFSNGTIYVVDSRAQFDEPSHEQVLAKLAEHLGGIVEKDYSQLVVGTNFSQTVIPKPEFFNAKHLRRYLTVAAGRLRKASFESAHMPKSNASPEEMAEMESLNWELIRKYQGREPTAEEVQTHIARFAEQQPDMGVWIFLSAACKLGLLGDISRAFEAVFGPGSYERFGQCPKQRQFVENMRNGVEIFGLMSGQEFGFPAHDHMETAEPRTRIRLLIDTVAGIVEKASSKQVAPSADTIAAQFGDDLIHPAQHPIEGGIETVAQQQLGGYVVSKQHAFSKAAKARVCPVCNHRFDVGTVSKKDFVASPDSHTNRGISHGATGYIVICDACKYERLLQQLLLGERAARVLVLTPRMHIGYWAGRTLYEQANRFYEEARGLMTNSTKNPNENITLALTNLIAANLLKEDDEGSMLQRAAREGLNGDTLARLLTYTPQPEKQKSHFHQLINDLRALYEFEEGKEDIEAINEEWEKSFQTWDEAVQAVYDGEVDVGAVEEIRAKIYHLREQFRVVCQTPNFALIPLVGSFKLKVGDGKESDTNAALRELFILLLVGLALDCSVAAIDAGEPIMFEGGEGVARVPAVPAVRDLVGSDWVGLTAAPVWLEKIGAASLLANDTAYPERSNLYQILTAMTPGHVLRRIEMKQKQGARTYHPQLILKALQEVPNA